MLLSEVINGVQGEVFCCRPGTDISGLAYDSREVMPGELFAALSGSNTTGNKYITQAVRQGAVFVLTDTYSSDCPVGQLVTPDTRRALRAISENFYRHPETRLQQVAITGTNGKTTIAQIIAHALRQLGKICGVLGTVGYDMVSRVIPAPLTTPESPDFQRYLAEMVTHGAEYAVCEFSSQALAQERVGGENASYAVFTNLSRDHLDNHGDMETYFLAKKRLFDSLSIGAFAVINTMDPVAERIVKDTAAEVVRVGRGEADDIRILEVEYDLRETRLKISLHGCNYAFKSALIGEYNTLNLLEALAVLLSMGFEMPEIIVAIGDFSGAGGRLERFDGSEGQAVFVDYAHTDDALANALGTLRKVTPGRLIVVFGCGGDRDRGKRSLMAQAAQNNADMVIITNDNPRSESPEQIMGDILAGIEDESVVRVEYDRRRAIEIGIGLAGAGDVVLIAGKGHEDYQILGSERIHFDDREVVVECLKKAKIFS